MLITVDLTEEDQAALQAAWRILKTSRGKHVRDGFQVFLMKVFQQAALQAALQAESSSKSEKESPCPDTM